MRDAGDVAVVVNRPKAVPLVEVRGTAKNFAVAVAVAVLVRIIAVAVAVAVLVRIIAVAAEEAGITDPRHMGVNRALHAPEDVFAHRAIRALGVGCVRVAIHAPPDALDRAATPVQVEV